MANCCFCYQPAGTEAWHPQCCETFFGQPQVPVNLPGQGGWEQAAAEVIAQRIAVTGVQPKLPLVSGDLQYQYIFKPQHPHFPAMPENEDLTMHLATLFGIDVCRHALVTAADGSWVYLAARMDRNGDQQLHMEDCCQLAEQPADKKYHGSYEKIGRLLAKHCTDPATDLKRFFELVLFSYLTGNSDMHLKNFSVLHQQHTITLAPAYDLLNIHLINPADTEELGLTLNARKRKIRLSDFVLLAERLGIPAATRDGIFHQFTVLDHRVAAWVNASFLKADDKENYLRIWERQQKILS
ncbi:serine/threonine-protein kinase HipA [Chitinophaga eiseniae]|uniref:Serine/threonine-protein kinase HipA n=1 Tax=Chitinophaga eiseniae TaxID=634771 RepID=A0A1T4SW51_9BACT|nr:HipA domain-containing protein [Chitinophaga eiseniae]SKA32423.1 serine/threonine-protein kinase HipA [Chitinophaga eiseniae]